MYKGSKGIIYKYEDGGMYCGEWEKDSAHGYGCGTGPGGRGKYEGLWEKGDQICGVYTWPKGMQYMGQWKNNQRDGLGRETREDGSEYCGMFIRGSKGPYGTFKSTNGSYLGFWRNGKQDGEGEEIYVDKGCYRGQYKNGVRSGCGTRTSAAYESRERCEITNSSHDSSKRSSLRSPFLHVKKNSNGSVSLSTTLSESATADGSAGHERFNSQIYEGEWKNDKRHGYGTIRIIGSYTYYGQWVSNAQTGYGVMVYENGAKEEGQWQSGQLMVALKRKKIHLKTHQLEVRVQSAHTMAIQAANAARNKALLAQSRATSATAKSKMALVVAVTAEKEAVLAREKAELYKNTTKISEGLTSPIWTPSLSDQFLQARENSTSDDSKRTSLDVSTDSITYSSSFEDVRTVMSHHSSDLSACNNDSDSETDSMDSSAHLMRRLNSPPSNSTVGGQRVYTDKKDPFRFQVGGSSVADMSFSYYNGEECPKTQRRFSNDPTLLEVGLKTSSNASHRLSVPDVLVEEMTVAELGEEKRSGSGLRKRLFSRRKRTKTTGELELSSSDDDKPDNQLGMKLKSPITKTVSPDPLDVKNTLTIEILVNNLNQMANWNKMIAYINFFLLVFLMVLILLVVVSMYYYQLVSYYHNHNPNEQGTTSFISPIA